MLQWHRKTCCRFRKRSHRNPCLRITKSRSAPDLLPAQSQLGDTALQLRKVASVLAFSERIVMRLHRKAVDQQMIDLMIQGFETLLAQVVNRNIEMPELDGAENKKIMKLKTVDAILDYANQLFALGRSN